MRQGNVAFSRGDYGLALRLYIKALEGIRADPDPLADLYGNVGNVYAAIGDIDEAIKHYKKAMEILRSIEDYGRLGITYVNIGNLYADQGNLEKGTHYYKQGVLLLEKSEKWDALSVLYGNLSLALHRRSEYEAASEYANKGMILAKKRNRPKLIAEATHRLAKAKEGMGETQEAHRLSESASSLYIQIDDELGLASTRYHQVFLNEKRGDLEAAIRCLKEVVGIDERYRLPKLEKNKTWLNELMAKKENSEP